MDNEFDEEEQSGPLLSSEVYVLISTLFFISLIMFLLASNITGVKVVLLLIITLKSYGFLYRGIPYEFYSTILYSIMAIYFFTIGG